jgi:hypothetical protein
MAIRSTYYSSNALHFHSDSTQAAYMSYSSQLIEQYGTGSISCIPLITAATSGYNPAFGHLTIAGSSTAAKTYYLDPPTSPYGQTISVKCLNTSTSTRQSVWASTDGSVTFDGTNQVAVFTSSGGSEVSNWFRAVSVSSQRWHLLGHSTTNLLLSTQSS